MDLRPYQSAASDAIFKEWQEHDSTLVVMPTGGGKTILFADVIRRVFPVPWAEYVRVRQERDVAMEMVSALPGQIEAMNRDPVRRTAEIDRLRALLRKVEWGPMIKEAHCVMCGQSQTDGHASGCHMAAELEGR